MYPDWLASFFFTTPEGLHAMSQTLWTAFVALQLYALSSILISVLQGAGYTREVFMIELTAVTLYVVMAYALTIAKTQPIHVIWRADWLYFSVMLLGAGYGLWRWPWRQSQGALTESANH